MKILLIIPGSENGPSFIFAKREYKTLKSEYPIQIEAEFISLKDSPASLFKQLIKIRSRILKEEFQIIHSHYGTITAFISLILSIGKKLVITFRGSDINGSEDVSFLRRKLALSLSWFAMAFADFCIFVSPNLKERSPCFFSSNMVIPSGVDTSSFFPIEKKIALKTTNLDQEKDYAFFYSSNNSRNKRPDLAEGAVNYLKNEFPKLELLNVTGNVTPSEVPYYMNSCSVVLMLSDKEGSPTIVQEALACGLPVITVDVGDAKEMVSGVPNCFIVDRTISSIAQGIKLGLKAGRISPSDKLLKKISLQSNVRKVVDIYESLIPDA